MWFQELGKRQNMFQKSSNARSINLFIKNSPGSLQNWITLLNGLLDVYKMITIVRKCSFKNLNLKKHYRNYKNFKISIFKKHVQVKT